MEIEVVNRYFLQAKGKRASDMGHLNWMSHLHYDGQTQIEPRGSDGNLWQPSAEMYPGVAFWQEWER